MFLTNRPPTTQSLQDRPAGSLTTKHIATLSKGRAYTWFPDPEQNNHNTDERGLYLCELTEAHCAKLMAMATFDRTGTAPYRVHVMLFWSNNFTGHCVIWSDQLPDEIAFDDLTARLIQTAQAILRGLAEEL